MSVLEKFYYQVGGLEGGSKLVFLHGMLGYSANWRRIAKAFEDRFQILVYDQRGHGRSFQPATGYSPKDYSSDLKEILTALSWNKIHLVGHSMGGRVALDFAKRFPELVTRLVIEDISPTTGPNPSNDVLRILDAVPVPFPDKRTAKAWFDDEFPKIFKNLRKPEILAAYLYANLIENSAKEAVWRFSVSGVRETIARSSESKWEILSGLKSPTLFVRGEYSDDLSREVLERILASNPLIEAVEIKGAGHWVHSDQPDLFIECLARFFRGETQLSHAQLEAFDKNPLGR